MPATQPATIDLADFVRKYDRLKTEGLRDNQIAKKLCITSATLADRLREHRRQQKRNG